ncbi:MAG TPA: hypothetical protein VG204_20115 [Terriglobia bacterium]|nr:hypothetical protein [Terriglobia bacterium]
MKRHFAIVLTVFALLTTAAACRSSKKVELAAQVWKSETTGNEYNVRVADDLLHAEWVNLPADMLRQGVYLRTECHRMGSKWVGVSDSRLPCSVGVAGDQRVIRWCELRTRIEIDSIADDRITGQAETVKRVDCQECKVLESGWASFVWTPKR